MLVLPNVLVDTARSVLNAQSGTAPPTAYLAGLVAHARPLTMGDYAALPAGALEAEFLFSFDAGTDVESQDILTRVVLRRDGVTPWGYSPTNDNETLRVLLAQDSTAGVLMYRRCFVKRYTGGGPAY